MRQVKEVGEKKYTGREIIEGMLSRALIAKDADRIERFTRQLEGPPFPQDLAYLWDWLMELDSGRSVGMNGPDPVSWQGIEAWARLMDHSLEPHEIIALLQLDVVLRNPTDEEEEEATDLGTRTRPSHPWAQN